MDGWIEKIAKELPAIAVFGLALTAIYVGLIWKMYSATLKSKDKAAGVLLKVAEALGELRGVIQSKED